MPAEHESQSTLPPPFVPGSLWSRLVAATGRALACGALQPIPTEPAFLEDGGIRFVVRIISQLARKPRGPEPVESRSGGWRNPFLPYDPEMHVAEISPNHVGLLNKFNVVPHHLLIVTRCFESQDLPLTREDFQALWRCLLEYDSLGFYNGGSVAGASQPHKHLQLVPLPLTPEGPKIPIEPRLVLPPADQIVSLPSLPFAHRLARLEPSGGEPAAAAQQSLAIYRRMLALDGEPSPSGSAEIGPYNLLVTRRWMLYVPRRAEHFASISLNALAFAGALLVRDREQLEVLRQRGPVAALREVTTDLR
jgi:ATP adenylyltransferase